MESSVYTHVQISENDQVTFVHVRVCRYFGTRMQFEEACRQQQERKLRAYVATLAADVRDELMRDIKDLLKDRRINVPGP